MTAPQPGADRPEQGSARDRPAPSFDVMAAFAQYRRTGDVAVRNRLVEEHHWIAVHGARRFARRGESFDDLVQVGEIGLLKAVERFDPELGYSFLTFAVPTVTGEIRRHFRDAGWGVKVPRRLKDLHVAVGAAITALGADFGRTPSSTEVADYLGVPVDAVEEAMEAGRGYRPSSIEPPTGEREHPSPPSLRVDDPGLRSAEDRVVVDRLLATLPEREQRIVRLRFFGELSQSEIAEQVGVSQVHVSRLLRASLAAMQRALRAEDAAGSSRSDPDDTAP